jgi:NTP pyrophosphatase (non-canonical NTP hydrolase)
VARPKLEWLQKNEMRKKEKLEALLEHLEDEMTQVLSLIQEEVNKDQ